MNMKNVYRETCQVVVVGAGHAGCEAALACARMGLETIIFTVSVDSIALMPTLTVKIIVSSKCGQHRIDALQSQHRRKLQRTSGAGN